MLLKFQRVKSSIGFALTMKIFVDDRLVYKLKNGEKFELELSEVKAVIIKTHRFIIDLEIPLGLIKKEADILLQYQMSLCKNRIQAIISENGKLIGIF